MLLAASLIVAITVLVAAFVLLTAPPRWFKPSMTAPTAIVGILLYIAAGATLILQAGPLS